jgi:hypothetical protein
MAGLMAETLDLILGFGIWEFIGYWGLGFGNSLGIGVWDLGIHWVLGFGIWGFPFIRPLKT